LAFQAIAGLSDDRDSTFFHTGLERFFAPLALPTKIFGVQHAVST
jgi:hypothetical protein